MTELQGTTTYRTKAAQQGAMTVDEPFVQFLFPCKCGTDLQIHGRYFQGGGFGLDDVVSCPKCNEKHSLPTKALRVFYRDGDVWHSVPSDSPVE